MQNIRIFFTKRDRAKYISHLDMTRLFQRAVRRSGITMWYTEGFHPHLYMTFALPLSLGIESECECVDMRLISNISLDGVKDMLNLALPEDIRVYDIKEPQMKANTIESSEYVVRLSGLAKYADLLNEFLDRNEILAVKKGKAGEKEVNIKNWIYDYEVQTEGKDIKLNLRLASGNTSTLNPQLVINTFAKQQNIEISAPFILRNKIFTQNGREFR